MGKIQLHLKSFDAKLLKNVLSFIENKLALGSINDSQQNVSIIRRNVYKKKYTVIRSPHVHKKSREQFELVEYHKLISLELKTIELVLLVLKLCNFYGIQMKVSVTSQSFLAVNVSF